MQMQREMTRLRAHLERIVETAHKNPDCLVCAEMRRIASDGLNSGPTPVRGWQT